MGKMIGYFPPSLRLFPHLVTNISSIQFTLLDTLQLPTGVRGLLSQGVTAVNHGCSVCALGPILVEFTKAGGGVVLNVHQCLPLWCNL